MKRLIASAILTTSVVAAHALAGEGGFHEQFANSIAEAHGQSAWTDQTALSADITIRFGGNVVLQGVMTFDTPVGQSRIETADGSVMVFDGKQAYVSPEDAPVPTGKARFHLLTWPYFVAAPFKLADPGTAMTDAGTMPLNSEASHPTGKLTFDPDTGDTPDDWYYVYKDQESHRLAGLAYIVTYGTALEDAEAEPHLATYDAYTTVGGVALPTRLSFWNWQPDTGAVGEAIGVVELNNYRFLAPDEQTFTQPEGARIDALPDPTNEG